jgi:adenylosuccinate lyase
MVPAMWGSTVHGHLWTTPETTALFDDDERIRRWMEILAELAGAQADVGIIPGASADEIARSARSTRLDLAAVAAETRATQHSTLGLVRVWQRNLSSEAGEHLCYGATVQDLTDTWTALVMREVAGLAERELRATAEQLMRLAIIHRGTPMAGRTHGQVGAPTTFGFKCALWCGEVHRHLLRLADGDARWGVGQLGGAVGVAGFWGADAEDLQARFCARLGLAPPLVPWLSARDGLAEFAGILAMAVHTMAKIGNEVLQLQRSEIGELREGSDRSQVGSITMPHKRNPEGAEHLVTLARLVRAQQQVLLEGMIVEHERDGRAWKAEWLAFPEVCQLSAAALAQGRILVEGLEVNEARMAANLEQAAGYVLSEQVLAAAAPALGKQRAHLAMLEATAAGVDAGRSMREAVLAHSALAGAVGEQLDDVLSVERATATAVRLCDRAVAALQGADLTESHRCR